MKIEQVDRAIYETIRKAVVESGYLPDEVLYLNDMEGYETAKNSLRNALPSGAALIEIHGVGNPSARGEKKDTTIYIERDTPKPGRLGASGLTKHEQYEEGEEVKFRKLQYPESSYDIGYKVRVVSNSTLMERVALHLVFQSMPSMGSLKGIEEDGSDSDESFLIVHTGGSEGFGKGNFKESMMMYEAQDVWIKDFKILREDIPRLKTVNRKTFLGDTEDNIEVPIAPI